MSEEEKNTIRQLTRLQRRVLGTLMEKGFTTPDQYPMTIKGATTGCNQKSNRDPVTEYSEAEVADALEQLRQLGLVAETSQMAAELLVTAIMRTNLILMKSDSLPSFLASAARLAARELRTRASRMVRIDSQEQLKADLQSLQDKGFVQSNGPWNAEVWRLTIRFISPKRI